jgi:hypothetical protein
LWEETGGLPNGAGQKKSTENKKKKVEGDWLMSGQW